MVGNMFGDEVDGRSILPADRIYPRSRLMGGAVG